jgi:hypothetical protein
MQDDKKDKGTEKNDPRNSDAPLRPDHETLHKTDTQENMEGPVSSLMHKTGHGFETEETKKEADKKKNEKM